MRGKGVSFQKIHTGSLQVHIEYIFALYNMLIGKGKAVYIELHGQYSGSVRWHVPADAAIFLADQRSAMRKMRSMAASSSFWN